MSSGYADESLAVLCCSTPSLDLAFAVANSQAGQNARIACREIDFLRTDESSWPTRLSYSARFRMALLRMGRSRQRDWSEGCGPLVRPEPKRPCQWSAVRIDGALQKKVGCLR